LMASRLTKRFGLSAAVRWGTLACVVSLALCALSGNFIVLSFARLLAGLGAAAGFVAGGALAAMISQSRPSRANFLLSLFYAGPGLGILSSGLIAPFVLQAFGPGSWWIVWWAMTVLGVLMTIPLMLTPIDANAGIAEAAPSKFAILPVLVYLAGYFLFGAGYIAYMTFMIAYVRDAGGGAAAQSAFWCLIGLSAFATPWVWRRVLARNSGGISTAIILGVNAVGAALPLFGHSALLLAISALVFGVAFFAVVGSTTAFVRFNYPPSAWPAGIAAMTIAFGIGQTLGPIAVGAVTDAMGSLSYALNVSAAMLGLGAIATAFQGKLSPTSSS
jgi:predicted MFS family arabinose efflux permease